MKNVLLLGYALFAGAVVSLVVFLAGVDGAGPVAFALAGFAIACVLPIVVTRMANWGVPGDESFGWLPKH
ncbi:MAG: hypothetical protein ABI345_11890 [Jatrophihabitans sp.]